MKTATARTSSTPSPTTTPHHARPGHDPRVRVTLSPRFTEPPATIERGTTLKGTIMRKSFKPENLDCANCAAKIGSRHQ